VDTLNINRTLGPLPQRDLPPVDMRISLVDYFGVAWIHLKKMVESDDR
jgi:hypothetical protein